MKKDAIISDCGRYRYSLVREWGFGHDTCMFIMLNPSTADANEDDPTIRRCIGFAAQWGFRRLAVANLFALRSTDPKALPFADDPVGPENDWMIGIMANKSTLRIAAWGASVRKVAAPREAELLAKFKTFGLPLYHLGLTKAGLPRHPLYLKGDTRPTVWT